MKKLFEKYIDQTAVVSNNKKYSYSDLLCFIQQKNEIIIKENIQQGEIVFILGNYSIQAIAWLLALKENKNIVVPVTSSVDKEVQERIEEAQADIIIDLRKNLITRKKVTSNRHDIIKGLIKQNKSGLIIFSSGSTGKPKAMVHDMDNLFSTYEKRKPRKMTFLVFLMFDHIGGLNTLFNCLATGAKIVIPNKRESEEICQLIQNNEVNILPTSPTFLNLMLMSGSIERYDLSSLRMITYGTEAMPESLLLRLKESFPMVKFLQTFGTSETGIIKTSSLSSHSTFIKMDDPDQEYKIVNSELWLRSKTQILGYMNHSMENFTKDGWFKTGDLVEEDGDYIKIKGRLKEVINVGGEKVLPIEVESVLLSQEQVLDCTVYGVDSPITGQTVVANIRLEKDIDKKEAKRNLRKLCKQKLDGYKVPTKFNFVEKTEFSNRFKKKR